MKMTDMYQKIIRHEPYNNMDIFFVEYDSFEEIPVVSRYHRLAFLQSEMTASNVSSYLAGLSIYILNSAKIISANNDLESIFFAITFTDFSFFEETATLIPNIFVYTKAREDDFFKRLISNRSAKISLEKEAVKACFINCGGEIFFDFFESRFFDEASEEELVRIFAVPKCTSERFKL